MLADARDLVFTCAKHDQSPFFTVQSYGEFSSLEKNRRLFTALSNASGSQDTSINVQVQELSSPRSPTLLLH